MKCPKWFRTAPLLLILSWGMAQGQDTIINTVHVVAAEKLIDLDFSPAQRDSMMDGLTQELQTIRYFHSLDLPNDLPMALDFDPRVPGRRYEMHQQPLVWKYPEVRLPQRKEDLAFYSILQLGSLIRHHKISSVELTRFFLDRLSRWGDTLHCLVTLTPAIALTQARKADSEFARGIDHGPLQGIPYGLKDLFSAAGTPTTWGSPPYRDQAPGPDSYVYTRLRKAGAVLVAKLSLGELAMGDVWFGGMTRNPWDLSEGSGGSSAGPASATAAGLVPFAIGTETWGSIVDPTSTCGLTSLRPSFGSVSRSGAMTLAWSSDKVGPLCRSAEDDALVFAAIHGTDGLDRSARWMPFNYSDQTRLSTLKMAYISNYMDSLPKQNPDRQVIAELTRLGAHLEPLAIPAHLHGSGILGTIIGAESAAAFDWLTRSHRDSLMVQQGSGDWPNQFRTSRFIPAVEYIQACRLRYRLLMQLDSLMGKFDVIVCPTFTGDQLALTNLTGYPVVVMPDGFDARGHPHSITFIGKLYGEGKLLAAARAYQDATGFHTRHPVLFH
ncbi:MAG TPA: amidase [Chitinophagaceae bacterium]|nr:amidase [Chitinophagaceae bacterium]